MPPPPQAVSGVSSVKGTELGILFFQGVAPIHPPTHTPPTSSALVVEDGEYFFSWDTDKSNGDDDDASVPPGAILVTALPNDLSENTNNNDSDESSTSGAVSVSPCSTKSPGRKKGTQSLTV